MSAHAKTRQLLSAIAGVVFFLMTGISASADTVDVSIPGFSFYPADLTVNVGTTVRWTNNHAVTHTTTSDNALWDSGNLIMRQSFSYTFESPGEFPYHCTIHPSMTANVTVTQSRPVPSMNYFGLAALILAILALAVWAGRRKSYRLN